MSITDLELGGQATVEIRGRTMTLNGVKFVPAGRSREAILGGKKIAGFKRGDPEPAKLVGTPVMDGRWTLDEIMTINNDTARVQMGNGDVWVLSGTCCSTVPEHDSNEGTTDEQTFLARESEKV